MHWSPLNTWFHSGQVVAMTAETADMHRRKCAAGTGDRVKRCGCPGKEKRLVRRNGRVEAVVGGGGESGRDAGGAGWWR